MLRITLLLRNILMETLGCCDFLASSCKELQMSGCVIFFTVV